MGNSGLNYHELEVALLSGLLNSPENVDAVQSLLRPDDFYSEKHRLIAAAIFAIGQHCDLMAVANWLRELGRLEAAGGEKYLMEVEGACSTAAGWPHHAKKIKEASQRRRVDQACREALDGLSDPQQELVNVVGDLNNAVSIVQAGEAAPLSQDDTNAVHFIEDEPPNREFLFEDLLPAGIVGGIIGAGGTSKTFLELALALGAATGWKVLGHFQAPKPIKVLALFFEDSQ
jgi:hypothetical protein